MARLQQAAGQAFYNASPFILKNLTSRATQQQLRDDFIAYLDGFSPNVQDILDKFEFRNQISRLSVADALAPLIQRFLSPTINLSPDPVKDAEGTVRLPGLDNHAMGTIFEDLLRRFNEENKRRSRRTLDSQRRGRVDGATGIPANRRPGSSPRPTSCTTAPLGPAACSR